MGGSDVADGANKKGAENGQCGGVADQKEDLCRSDDLDCEHAHSEGPSCGAHAPSDPKRISPVVVPIL